MKSVYISITAILLILLNFFPGCAKEDLQELLQLESYSDGKYSILKLYFYKDTKLVGLVDSAMEEDPDAVTGSEDAQGEQAAPGTQGETQVASAVAGTTSGGGGGGCLVANLVEPPTNFVANLVQSNVCSKRVAHTVASLKRDGASDEEIAKYLGVSVDGAKSRVTAMEDEDISSTSSTRYKIVTIKNAYFLSKNWSVVDCRYV